MTTTTTVPAQLWQDTNNNDSNQNHSNDSINDTSGSNSGTNTIITIYKQKKFTTAIFLFRGLGSTFKDPLPPNSVLLAVSARIYGVFGGWGLPSVATLTLQGKALGDFGLNLTRSASGNPPCDSKFWSLVQQQQQLLPSPPALRL